MKAFICKYLLTIFLISIYSYTDAQVSVDKEEKKIFKVKKNTNIYIENKYGDIVIETWDKDSVYFDISVKVNAQDDGKAFDLLDRISFEGINSGQHLSFKTVFLPHKSKITNFFRTVVSADRSNVDINYVVYMPAYNNLTIENKFGDIFLPSFAGELDIMLSHGDLKASSMKQADIEISYGDFNASNIEKGYLESKFGDVDINGTDHLRLDANGSDINIGKVNYLDVNINKGSLFVDNIDNLVGSISIAEVNLGTLMQSLDLDLKYTELTVSKVDPSCKTIRLEQKASDTNIDVKDLSYHLDAELKGGSIQSNRQSGDFTVQELDNKNHRRVSGKNAETINTMIYMIATNSEIKLEN